VVLGPDKLPDLAQRAGRAYRDLQRLREHLNFGLDDLLGDEPADPVPAPASRPTVRNPRPAVALGAPAPRPARHHPPRPGRRSGIIEP
jgi:hypothetical protein